ncbi:MAG: tetratricopeptide repeat protein [Planctomycetota bacterium]
MIRPTSERSIDTQLRSLVNQHISTVEANAREALPRCTLGMVYEANELWFEAQQCYEQGIAMGATDPVWKYHQAVCTRQAGDSVAAMELAAALVAAYPDFPALQHLYAKWLMEAGRHQEAADAFRRARGLSPETVEPVVGLGTCLVRLGKYQDAVRLLEPAVAEDPDYRAAAYALGLAYRALGRKDEASVYLARGVDAKIRNLADPRTADIVSYRVSLSTVIDGAADMIDAGNYAGAAERLEAANRSRPNDVRIMTNLAAAYRGLGRMDEAMAMLETVTQLDPTQFASHMNLASNLLDLGRPEEALRSAELAVKHGETIGRAHYIKAKCLSTLRRYEEALASLEMAARLDVRDPQLFEALGGTCAMLRKFPEARVYYERGLQMRPDALHMLLGLAEVNIRLNDVASARDAFESAKRIAPAHPRVLAFEERLVQLESAGG